MDLNKWNHKKIYANRSTNCPLSILVTVLKNHPPQLSALLEVQLLKKFSPIEVIPKMSFKPRTIIEDMMKIHAECTAVILKNPDYLTKLVYKYNSGGNEEEYVFSNNMPFCFDIVTICFLHILRATKRDRFQSVNDLMAIMRKKYHISNIETLDPLILTESKIVITYSSVSINLLYSFSNSISSFLSIILLKWNLTNIFCAPWLALIIPEIESEHRTPLALLLATAVVLDNENTPSYELYQRIVTLYTSNAFPSSYKLAVCVHWGIVFKKGNRYTFASYFTTLREEAIDLIKTIKLNDTSIEYTLSQI